MIGQGTGGKGNMEKGRGMIRQTEGKEGKMRGKEGGKVMLREGRVEGEG